VLGIVLTNKIAIIDYKLYYDGINVNYAPEYIVLLLSRDIQKVFDYLTYGNDDMPKLSLVDFQNWQYLTEEEATQSYKKFNGFKSSIFNRPSSDEKTEKRLQSILRVINNDLGYEKNNPLNTKDTIDFFGKSDVIDQEIEEYIERKAKKQGFNKLDPINIQAILTKHNITNIKPGIIMSNFPKDRTPEREAFEETVRCLEGDEFEIFILSFNIIKIKKDKKKKTVGTTTIDEIDESTTKL